MFDFVKVLFSLSLLRLPSTAEHNFDVVSFLADIQRLHGFRNVLIMQNRNATMSSKFVLELSLREDSSKEDHSVRWSAQFVKRLMETVYKPVLQMNENTSFYLKQNNNDQMISVVLVDGTFGEHLSLFTQLVLNLRHMTLSKVLFLLNFGEEQKEFLNTLFKFCWAHKMINVVAVFSNYLDTLTFYSYTNFPNFRLEVNRLNINTTLNIDVYPDRLRDLKGYKLPYILGGSDPRIIIHRKPNGKVSILGFAGHLLKAFANKYNCQLFEPLSTKSNSLAPGQDLIAAVRNGTADISAALTFPSIPFYGFTYPFEQVSWCVVLPVEPDIPNYKFYIIVFELRAFLLTLTAIILISLILSAALYQRGFKVDLLNLVFHDNCLRGAMGQTFIEVVRAPPIVRFIYLKICVLGILLTTSYNAYFATYLTSAPKESPLTSFDEILRSSLKVFAFTPEFNELIGRVAEFRRYIPMFHLESNFQEYLKMRDTLNTKYGYMMPTTKWNVVHEQQKIFTSPLFKRDENLCFFNNIPMCFPVHENSIFMQSLHQLILETAQSGLTNHWQEMGFIEMIMAGKLSFADLSTKRNFEAMQVQDLYYIWFGFGFMICAASLVFVTEFIVFNRKRVSRFIIKCLRNCTNVLLRGKL